MRCKYCGGEIREGAKFCPNCGARQDDSGKTAYGTAAGYGHYDTGHAAGYGAYGAAPSVRYEETGPRPMSKGLCIAAGILGIASLILFGIETWEMSGRFDNAYQIGLAGYFESHWVFVLTGALAFLGTAIFSFLAPKGNLRKLTIIPPVLILIREVYSFIQIFTLGQYFSLRSLYSILQILTVLAIAGMTVLYTILLLARSDKVRKVTGILAIIYNSLYVVYAGLVYVGGLVFYWFAMVLYVIAYLLLAIALFRMRSVRKTVYEGGAPAYGGGGYGAPAYGNGGYGAPAYGSGGNGARNAYGAGPAGGAPGYTPDGRPLPVDAPSGGFWALCFFFPTVGLILFLVWKDTLPRRARSCGIGALVGFCVWMGLLILTYVIAIVVGLSFLWW